MKIIVFGASGRLGSKIIEYANLNKVKCISVGNKKKCDLNLDLTKTDVSKILKKQKPSIIFNCVALTNVDFCNKNFSKAYKTNVITIENLSKAIVKSNIKTKLIHISTDQVYNNTLIRKKNNEKNINLSNGYSITKFMGELEALKYNNALVIRTNFFGNVFSQNIQTYTDYITNNLIKKKKIKVANNIIFNPINLDTLVKNLFLLARTNLKGIYNIGSKDYTSKFLFAKKIAKKFKLNSSYIIPFKSNYSKDKRPLGTFMSVNKFEKKTGIRLPKIDQEISIL